MPPLYFSPAEKESAVTIALRFGGVSPEALESIHTALGKYVSAQTVRFWVRTKIRPPKLPRPKRRSPIKSEPTGAIEAVSPGEGANDHDNLSLPDESNDIADLPYPEKIEKLLNLLTNRALSAEQVGFLNGEKLHRAMTTLIDKWLSLRHLNPAVLSLVQEIEALIEVCRLNAWEPREVLVDFVSELRRQAGEPEPLTISEPLYIGQAEARQTILVEREGLEES